MVYDVAIIGTGPAAVSAALTLQLHNKTLLWFGPKQMSAKVEKSECIANYPGVPMTTGADFNRLLLDQIEQTGLAVTEKQITSILPMGDTYMMQGGTDIYSARAVLLCTGAASPAGFPGEDALLGSGVSYCATCDGFLYKGRTIAVYCGARQFEHEALYLAELAEKVYLFTPYEDCGVTGENIVVNAGKLKAIRGAESPAGPAASNQPAGPVSAIELTDGTAVDVSGVFILREALAPAKLVPGLETDGAAIVTDKKMRTNLPGCFAAGDCTGRPYQIAKATGEGNIAAHSIIEYLSAKE